MVSKKKEKTKVDRVTILIFSLIVFLAGFLRLYKLDNRPAHFDEGGGHAIGARELYNTGRYIYNPDFHGPFLYHVTAFSFYLFGMSDITLRLMQALFGIGTVIILFPLRKYLSRFSFLFLALMIGISPSLVYYSRFAVHDSFFVFFSTACIVFLFLYDKERKNIYLYLFSASLAFLFTVKENSYIFLATLVMFFGFEFLASSITKKGIKLKKNFKSIKNWISDNRSVILKCLIIFSFVFSLIYTSFFRFPKNLYTALTQPFLHWFKKSTTQTGFFQPHSFYLRILKEYDFLIFYPGLLGIFTFIFDNNRLTRFSFLFGGLSLLIYLLIPYKEPNNVVHITLPLAISAGIFLETLSRRLGSKTTIILSIFILPIVAYSINVCWNLSFVRYSDEKNYLVYVQTVDDIKPMLKLVKEITDKKGKDIPILVDVPQTEYPISWYFRDYTNVRYISEKVELPNGWTGIKWSGDGMIIWDSSEAKTGNRSGKIFSGNGTDGEWRQKIPIIGGYNYKLSGWIKTKNIQVVDAGEYAKIYVRTDKNDQPDRIIARTNSLTGTNDWTFVETSFFLERGENYIWLTMTIGNWGKTKGEIWFDDISLVREGTNENLIVNPSFEDGNKIDKLMGPEILIISEEDGQTLMPIPGYTLQKYLLRPGVNLAVYVKK
ncbi:MAG: TIGR03663 family protein [Candidatus Aenigmatarchaeota archaeon]